MTARISGLAAGEEYTAWLGYGALPAGCLEPSCGPIAMDSDDPTASMQRIGAATVQPAGILELEGELPEVRLVHGSKFVLQIVGERGPAGPYARATFIVP